METLHFEFVATEPPVKSIGRMCWLGRFRNFDGTRRNRKSFYSGSNFGRWQCGALAQSFERIFTAQIPPAVNIDIHDFGATPGVVRLRLEQALEEIAHD